MDREEALELLRGGKEGVKAWNQWRKDNPDGVPDLSEANLRGADLSGANLRGLALRDADLTHAVLIGATLIGVNLSGADLIGATLIGADLSRSALSGVALRDAALSRATLRGANLRRATLIGAALRGANLRDANLRDADLSRATLIGTSLENADLTRCRFIGCNLRDAVVENARVTDVDIQRLTGLPRPPEQLRIRKDNDEIFLLTGFDAREFFNLPAIVEVYVTTELTQQELGCYHFHFGEMHHEGVATGVYFIGHRHEHGGSVLRFQGKSYDEIYQVLPDLLAPFRMAEAVDWKQTIQAIPAEERGDAITALATVEPKPPVVEWRFAKRMAEVFDGYRNANVNRISEWGSRRISIEIIENPYEVQRLSQRLSPEPWDEHKRIHIETGGGPATIQLADEVYNMSTQHFHGGHFQGCSFGDHNSLTNYFGVVDNLSTAEEDIKEKLKEAREAIENSDLPNDDKADMVEQLNNLTGELEKSDADSIRIQRFWSRIKETAPTVASILASAASLGKILGLG